MQRPKYIRPGDESLYPARNKDGVETFLDPNTDVALSVDNDSRTNFVYNRYHHLPMDSQRQKLPVFQYRNHILYLMEKYQTLVLIGETGCGKSTQVPQYMHEIGHRVCVTQPRVAAAASLAARVCEEAGPVAGFVAGMVQSGTDCGIVFMTEGVLLREMFASPLLMQYSCIILDEVHERSQMTDVLMGLLKKVAKKRKNLKIIVSSATMDAEFLRDFFNLKEKSERDRNSTSVIMSIQGRTHPIDLFYSEEPVPDYVKATIDTVIKIHENEPFGDILAFLTSQEEILSALEILRTYADENNEKNKFRKVFPSGVQAANMSVLPMYGSLPFYRQIKVFQTADKNVRKVVLATNIAETSVTIAGIVYVIDSGFHKLPYYDPSIGVESVCVTSIARSNAAQRAGRAGRTQRGRCYRLYTEAEFDKMAKSVPPEICRSDLTTMLLRLKALGIHNLLKFTFPTPPPAKSLLSSIETLYALRAIDSSGALTEDATPLAEMPLPAECAAMLWRIGKFGCIDEALSIAAMLQIDNVFIKTGSGKESIAARTSRRNNFEVEEGDLIMYLNIMDAYIRVYSSCEEKRSKKACKEWCQKMYLNHRVMEKAYEIRSSLEKLVKNKFKMENEEFEGPDLGRDKLERIVKCVISGYFSRAARLNAEAAYTSVKGAVLHISTDSWLYRRQRPQWVVFTSVQNVGDKTYMRDVTPVKKEWLLEVAPHYYTER